MKKIIVSGGKPLVGNITVSGSKNAALPIIFSCILTNGVNEIENLPDIGDTRAAISILRELGAIIESKGDFTYIDTRNLVYRRPSENLVASIRASTYLIGSCLSRFCVCPLMEFGGCNFSLRPIDMHLDACVSFGGKIYENEIRADRLIGCEICFRKPSVGATVNSILLAVSSEGDSVIKGCAIEPHIDCLIAFLNSAGASIRRVNNIICVSGRELHGGKIKIIGDMIEAGSYLALGIMTNGNVTATNCPVSDMQSIFTALTSLGGRFVVEEERATAYLGEKGAYLSLVAEPYPGFPTDLQPIVAPLMASLSGGEICDKVWSDRFGYLDSLSGFGIFSKTEQGNKKIQPSNIHSGNAKAPDLRGGFACLMCALFANGNSVIESAETILRGYGNLEDKLHALGADIDIVDL